MTDEEPNDVVCIDCEAVVTLQETPYEDTDYVLSCECDGRSVDVSDVLNGSPIVHPIAGKWSNIDHDHGADR